MRGAGLDNDAVQENAIREPEDPLWIDRKSGFGNAKSAGFIAVEQSPACLQQWECARAKLGNKAVNLQQLTTDEIGDCRR